MNKFQTQLSIDDPVVLKDGNGHELLVKSSNGSQFSAYLNGGFHFYGGTPSYHPFS